MTADLLAAHRALVEAALAARDLMDGPVPRRLVRLRDAIDAYRALDPDGSELARLAAIGAAVERLPAEWKLVRDSYEPHYTAVAYSESSMAADRSGIGPTLHAAVAAALGEP